MLEFLGFIALISIMFGISFATALGGFLKFIVIAIAIIIGLWVVAKMLESKNGTICLISASVIAICLGVIMINDDLTKRDDYCNTGVFSYDNKCYVKAVDEHYETINKGWAYSICGGIGALLGIGTWSQINEKEKKAKGSSKKIIEYTEED